MSECQFCNEKFYHELLLENHQKREHMHELIKYKAALNPPLFANAEATLDVDLRKVKKEESNKVTNASDSDPNKESDDKKNKRQLRDPPKPSKRIKAPGTAVDAAIVKQEFVEGEVAPVPRPPPRWGESEDEEENEVAGARRRNRGSVLEPEVSMEVDGYYDDYEIVLPTFRCAECSQEFQTAKQLSDHVIERHAPPVAKKADNADPSEESEDVKVKSEPSDQTSGAFGDHFMNAPESDVKLEQIKMEEMVENIFEDPDVMTALKQESADNDDDFGQDYEEEEEEEDPDYQISAIKAKKGRHRRRRPPKLEADEFEEEPYSEDLSCQKCNKYFKNKRGLKNHRCEISHSCDLCGRVGPQLDHNFILVVYVFCYNYYSLPIV